VKGGRRRIFFLLLLGGLRFPNEIPNYPIDIEEEEKYFFFQEEEEFVFTIHILVMRLEEEEIFF
jgi:hypothetical protein